MSKVVLFAGKDFPFSRDFASGAALGGRKVFLASDEYSEEEKIPTGITIFKWNRSSIISSRSVLINLENEGELDEVVLFFDEPFFAEKFKNANGNEEVLETLFLSYQYFMKELIQRSLKNPEKKIKIVFVHKENPSLAESLSSNIGKLLTSTVSNSLVSAAAASFRAYAENEAAKLLESNISVFLVSCDYFNEHQKKDGSLAVWLCSYLDFFENSKKSLSAKQKLTWIKAGAKPSFGLSDIFRSGTAK